MGRGASGRSSAAHWGAGRVADVCVPWCPHRASVSPSASGRESLRASDGGGTAAPAGPAALSAPFNQRRRGRAVVRAGGPWRLRIPAPSGGSLPGAPGLHPARYACAAGRPPGAPGVGCCMFRVKSMHPVRSEWELEGSSFLWWALVTSGKFSVEQPYHLPAVTGVLGSGQVPRSCGAPALWPGRLCVPGSASCFVLRSSGENKAALASSR